MADRVKRSGNNRIDAGVYWSNLERKILVNPLSRIGCDIYRFGVANIYDNAEKKYQGLVPTFFLLEAIGHRSRVAGIEPLESLTFEIPQDAHRLFIKHPKRFIGREAYGPISKAERKARHKAIAHVFVELKHLVLLCPGPLDKNDSMSWTAGNETRLFLESATNLQSLELAYGIADRIREDRVILLWLLSRHKTTFPRLQTFKLGAKFPPNYLINFLSQHKFTLRSLEMKDCVSYNWRETLAFIAQELKPEQFHAKFL